MLIQLVVNAIVVSVHLLAMTACARALGIRVRMVNLGIGPEVLAVGCFCLASLPINANVRLATSAELAGGEPDLGTLDHAARWKRVLLPLSGPLALPGLGACLPGAPAIGQCIRSFPQWIGGTLFPLAAAQVL